VSQTTAEIKTQTLPPTTATTIVAVAVCFYTQSIETNNVTNLTMLETFSATFLFYTFALR
jgi:hypothetical protein